MGRRHCTRTILLTGLITAAWVFSGCVSLSNFQSAEALKKGDYDIGVGITATTISPTLQAEEDELYEDVTYGITEFLLRYGVADRWDVGGKIYGVSPFFGVTFDVKYQFHDGEKFDSAIDLGLGMAGIEIDGDETEYLDYYGSLLFTAHLDDTTSLTFSPKVIARDIDAPEESLTETITGATLTLSLGKEEGMRFLPEIGYYTSDVTDFIHYGLGFKW